MKWQLDADDLAFYQENGYWIVDDAFGPAELEGFDRALLHAVRVFVRQAAGGANPFAGSASAHEEIDRATEWLEERDHYYIAQLYHTIADIPEFLRLGIKPELSRIAAQLLAVDAETPLYTLTKRCRIDLSRETDYTFGWHQEVFYSIPKSRFLQTWAPLLRPATVANGTIEIAVGSHRGGVAAQVWNVKDGVPNQILVRDEVIDRCRIMPVLLQPGQLVMFSDKTAHRSGRNTSGTTRFSLVSSFHRMDAPDFQAPRFRGEYLGLEPQAYYQSLLQRPVAAGEPERVRS